MKKLISLLLIGMSFNTMASDQEMNLEVAIAGGQLSMIETYEGEPVSRRRRLVVTHSCNGNKSEIYNDNHCDFTNFKVRDDGLSFTAVFYNPDTGECSGPKSKDFNLKITKCN